MCCWSMSCGTMVIMSATMICPMFIVCCTYFMKLNTIGCIIFFSIKSNITEIVPDREECSVDEIRQEELVEHQHNRQWDDNILLCNYESIKLRVLDSIEIKRCIFEKGEDSSWLENIHLFCHIDHRSAHCKEKEDRRKKIECCIECWMCWLRYDESSMKWKEHSKNIYKIDRNTHNKYWKPKWKKSSIRSENSISEKENREENIDTESHYSAKCHLKYLVKGEVIVKNDGKDKEKYAKSRIKWCHRKCLSKRIKNFHFRGRRVIPRLYRRAWGNQGILRGDWLLDLEAREVGDRESISSIIWTWELCQSEEHLERFLYLRFFCKSISSNSLLYL